MGNKLQLGYGRSKITPPLEKELCGFGYYLGRKATGVHDDLYAYCLYFSHKGKDILLVNMDLIGLSTDMVARIQNHLAACLFVEPDNVVLTSTHTHTGPPTNVLVGCGEPNDEYLIRLPELIAEAAVAAREDRREVRRICLGLGEATGLARNREGGDFLDEHLYSVRVERVAAQTVTILHYACHPIMNSCSEHVSADYPGYIIRALTEQGELGCYINGLCGNINPLKCMPDTMGTPEKLYEDGALDRILGDFASAIQEAYIGSEYRDLPLSEIVGSGEAAGPADAGIFSVEFIRVAMPLRPQSPVDIDAIVAEESEKYGSESAYLRVVRAWRDYQSDQIATKRRAGEPIFIENVGIYLLRLGSLILVTIPYEAFAEIAH